MNTARQFADLFLHSAARRGPTPMAPTELELLPVIEADIRAEYLNDGEDDEDQDIEVIGANRTVKRILAVVEAISQYIPDANLDAAYRDAMRAFKEVN